MEQETDRQLKRLEEAAKKEFGIGYNHHLNLWRLLISVLAAIINEIRSK